MGSTIQCELKFYENIRNFYHNITGHENVKINQVMSKFRAKSFVVIFIKLLFMFLHILIPKGDHKATVTVI